MLIEKELEMLNLLKEKIEIKPKQINKNANKNTLNCFKKMTLLF